PGESWNGVDLVHPDARLALEKEVDAGEPGGVDGAEGRDGETLELPHEVVTQRGRDDDLGDAVRVLRLVVVPFLAGTNLARHRGFRVVVPQHADLDLPGSDSALHQDLAIVGEGDRDRVGQLRRAVDLGDAD